MMQKNNPGPKNKNSQGHGILTLPQRLVSRPGQVGEGAGIFYGWWVALSFMFLVVFSAGIAYYGFSAFVTPLADEFGWKRATIAAAFSLRGIEAGFAAPVIGFLLDRFGSRRIILFGVLTMALGLVLFSRINSLVSFYAAYIVVALGFSACGGQVAMSTVARWFIRNRGKALGLVSSGAGITGILAPLLVWSIGHYGWRTTLLFEALGILIVGIPISFFIRNSPEEYGDLPDGKPDKTASSNQEIGSKATHEADTGLPEAKFTVGQAVRTRAFWLLSLIFGLQAMVIAAVFVHLIPYLISIGFSPQMAALGMTVATVTSLAGRFGFGWLGDMIDKRHAIAIAAALTSIGLLIFALISGPWMLVPFALTFSLGYAGAIPLRGAIQGDYFGRASFGAIQGLIVGVGVLMGIVGPVFAGWTFDTWGTYRPAFAFFALVAAAPIPLALAFRRPQPASSSSKPSQ